MKNRLVDIAGKGECGTNSGNRLIYVLLCVEQMTVGKVLTAAEFYLMLCDLEGQDGTVGLEGGSRGGDIYIFVTDSCCCTTEANAL